ncbi:S-adenosyl-L-methionine-dependent methyltransferase [Amylostereum chailletii]|nr:S-adenosyl-L-methionine-dependent methyltransferase [Amylostereum chailletii]
MPSALILNWARTFFSILNFYPSSYSKMPALVSIIQGSVDAIEKAVEAQSLEFPSLATPFTPQSEAARNLPEVAQASALLVSAATQLVAAARSPEQSMTVVTFQHALSSALRVAIEANVVEVLREAGPQGAHVNDIAQASNIDPSKLARVLRVLATNHIFTEVDPDVFTNNRLSSLIDTGKSVQSIKDSPETKYIGTNGVCAGICHSTDEAFKACSYLPEVLLDPKTSKSDEPSETAFGKAFNFNGPIWEWFELPENAFKLTRFGLGMEGSKHAFPNAILEGFDWNGLKSGALVVDVGGGVGAQCLTLAKNHPHLRFVVQDREPVVKEAVAVWDARFPNAVSSGQVVLQGHDFFTAEPVKNADVFLLRMILHDWSDKYCVKILRNLRDAAMPSTRLLIVDSLIGYACADDSIKDIPGALLPSPPAPLLSNLGHTATIAYYLDMNMMELLNGKERTIAQFRELLKETGWELVEVNHGVPGSLGGQKIIAVPA